VNIALNIVALKTIVRKEVVRVLRIWIQTVVPPAITMTLYFIIFGNLIGRRIGTMDGFDYMQYIAPGLIMMSVITNSYGNVVSSFFGAKFGRHIEEMLISPMSNATIIIGHVAGGMLRGVLVGLLVTIVALFFTKLEVRHPFITVSIVLLSSAVFALAGFINAVFAKKFDDISIVMVNAFRYGILGTSDIGIGTAYGILLVFVVLLFIACQQLMRRGVGIRE